MTDTELSRTLKAKTAELTAAGVRYAQAEFVDINGYVRGKLAPLERALSPSGSGANSLVHALLSADGICITPYSNFENSFPKLVAIPDPATVARWSWRPDTASVFCDLFAEDGAPAPYDGRAILKSAVTRLEALGFEAKAALEYEFFLFHEDDALIRDGRLRDLVPLGRTSSPYSVSHSVLFDDLAREYFRRTADLGIAVEAFHTEYGVGMYEYAFEPAGPVQAADNAARGKLYMKQLAAERGLVATYMPAVGRRADDTSCGAHHNVSLWRDGDNLMWDAERRGLGPVARQFAAGILASMPDLHLLFRPLINSYRRMSRWHFSPENASWGLDHHTAAVRVVHGTAPARQSRLEHRVAGADVNPYLTLAAILLAGAWGIEQRLEPPPYSIGDPVEGGGGAMLPASLDASVAAFETSPIARELFGAAFVAHYALLKRAEADAFRTWLQAQPTPPAEGEVTDWERAQYFEWA